MTWLWILLVPLAALVVVVVVYDLTQRRSAVLRNFPIVGHLRFMLEGIGPELRQYIVTDNDSERPFSRDERRWVYASAKNENNYFGFGTDNDLERSSGYVIIKPSAFPVPSPHPGEPGWDDDHRIPVGKVLGGARQRAKAFRMASVVNVSSMSYGALGAHAVEALNRGVAIDGLLQGTGEGGISDHHRHGGDLVWQIGTGYFGCRDADGRFDLERFKDTVAANPQVRAIEIKLSQGAKPGLGGVLPGVKVTPEIAAIRGIPVGVTCVSPPAHRAFHDVDSMLDFVELLATESGLPVGVKTAVGHADFFAEITRLMASNDRGVDFITIDGGEGGTGAGPLAFTDSVALPFKVGFARALRELQEHDVAERVVLIGSGRLGLPVQALIAFGLGADAVNVGREAMLALGCIQAQRCHTDRCPSGVATHNRWLERGLVPEVKSHRVANYLRQLRRELLWLSRACGVHHPALVTLDRLEVLEAGYAVRSAAETFGYHADWGAPSPERAAEINELMNRKASRG
ncbi:MAG: glutamate synthase-related protein [Acidimicrobiia bacterium]